MKAAKYPPNGSKTSGNILLGLNPPQRGIGMRIAPVKYQSSPSNGTTGTIIVKNKYSENAIAICVI